MTNELTGRTALVIGGAAGMGLASAHLFAAQGALVIVADRDAAAAERAAAAVRTRGGSAVSYGVDASLPSELEKLFNFTSQHYGSLNVLFTVVGLRGPEGFDVTEKDFDDVLAVNVKHHFFATLLAQPLMKLCAPHASIIFMGSAAAFRYTGGSPLYAISKAALLMMTTVFARHLGPLGIRVNALCPGPIDTAFSTQGVEPELRQRIVERWTNEIPLRRIAVAEDVANAALFFASDRSMYITGTALPVDGGISA